MVITNKILWYCIDSVSSNNFRVSGMRQNHVLVCWQ